jgi:RNA recognition motif-containing protein
MEGTPSPHEPKREEEMGNRLYVGNLSFDATEDSVRAAFAEAGEVVEVKIISDRDSGRSRGFGFVTMGSAESAQKAITQMNGAMLDGRALKVNEAEERRERTGGGGFGGGGGGRSGGGGGGGGGRGGGRGGGGGDKRGGNRW